MRGKDSLRPAVASTIGITPAYAGKSVVSFISFHHHMDHPRVCGEKAYNSEMAGSL